MPPSPLRLGVRIGHTPGFGSCCRQKGALAPLLDIGLHLLACIKELFHRLNEGLLGLLFRGLRCRRRRGGRRGGRRARCRQLFCGSAHIGDRWSCHSVHSPPCRSASLPLAYWSSGSRGYRGSNSPPLLWRSRQSSLFKESHLVQMRKRCRQAGAGWGCATQRSCAPARTHSPCFGYGPRGGAVGEAFRSVRWVCFFHLFAPRHERAPCGCARARPRVFLASQHYFVCVHSCVAVHLGWPFGDAAKPATSWKWGLSASSSAAQRVHQAHSRLCLTPAKTGSPACLAPPAPWARSPYHCFD